MDWVLLGSVLRISRLLVFLMFINEFIKYLFNFFNGWYLWLFGKL